MLTRSQRKRMGSPYGEYEFRMKNVCNQKYWNEYLEHVRILLIEEECGIHREPPRIYAAERCKRHDQERLPKHALAWNDATEQCKREAARGIKEDPEKNIAMLRPDWDRRE